MLLKFCNLQSDKQTQCIYQVILQSTHNNTITLGYDDTNIEKISLPISKCLYI